MVAQPCRLCPDASFDNLGADLLHASCRAGVAGANDERMGALMRAMNRLLDKHPQSRRRHLAWHVPTIVPVWPQVPPPPPPLLWHVLSALELPAAACQSSSVLFCACPYFLPAARRQA